MLVGFKGPSWLNRMSDLKKPNGYWTKEKLLEEAKKFPNLKEWRENSQSSYVTATRKKLIDEICEYLNFEKRIDLSESVIIEKIKGRNFSLIPNSFVSVHSPAKWVCHDCDEIFSSRVNHVLYNNVSCRKCAVKVGGKLRRKSIDEIIEKLKLKNIALLNPSEYEGVNQRTDFVCLSDASHPSWNALPYSLLNPSSSTGCPVCSQRVPITKETLVDAVKGKPIEVVIFVSGAHSKSLFKCLTDSSHNNWSATNASIYQVGSGCPSCAKYGFDSGKPAYFYCIPLFNKEFGEVYGFGITNDWSGRCKKHKKNLLKKGFTWGVPRSVLIEDGRLTRKLETTIKTYLKQNNFSLNLGVEGFTTEAFKTEGLVFVEAQLKTVLKESAEMPLLTHNAHTEI